ncbi:MAG: sigma-70 family RNA polymerase sigma factor [Chloroflexota bacterium]
MQTNVTDQPSKVQKPKTPINAEMAAQFQAHHSRIYNYVRYRVDVMEDAEDLVSAIFERAFTRFEQYDENKAQFSTWLFHIAHSVVSNYFRSRERQSNWQTGTEPPPDLIGVDPSPEEALIQQEAIVTLLQGLSNLSERDQEVISLKFMGRLGNKAIGEIMDLKEKTVSVTLLRAMRRLRTEMEKEAAS